MGNGPAGGTWENDRKIGNMKGKWEIDLPGEPGGARNRALPLEVE